VIRQIYVVLLALLPAACSGNSVHDSENTALPGYSRDTRPLGKTMVYECSEYEFITRLGPGEMAVWLEDRYLVLSRVRSASGVKYQEGDTVFFSKGEDVLLELDGQRHTDCRQVPARVPWEDARRRGVNFRAVGNEPGWHLEIREGQHLLFVGDYGALRVMTPDPGVHRDGAARTYQASSEAQKLQVEILDEPCTDTMKGDVYPSRVSVQVAGKVYRGCGRDLKIPWQ